MRMINITLDAVSVFSEAAVRTGSLYWQTVEQYVRYL